MTYFCTLQEYTVVRDRYEDILLIVAFRALILFLSQNDIFTVSFALAILRTKRFVEEAANAPFTIVTLPHPFSVV